MPTAIKLQWHKSTKRWRKKINGKDYYFHGGKGTCKTNMDGYRKAWQEYLTLVDGFIKGSANSPEEVSKADKLRFFEAIGKGSSDEAEELRQELNSQAIAIENGTYQPAVQGSDFVSGAGWQFFAEDRSNWVDRLQTLNAITKHTDGVMFAEAVQMFLNFKKQSAQSGNLSAGRWDFLGRVLGICSSYVGNVPVSSINGTTLTRVYHSISGNPDWSNEYMKSLFVVFRQFVKWCWEQEMIENLPRNFSSKEFKFLGGKKPQKKVVFEKERIHQILDKAPDKIKLWVLLALNCGFTQVDISDLEKSEIDLEAGTITRKRSKTKDSSGVPTVCYKLWDSTLELLKKQIHKGKSQLCFLTRNKTPYVQQEVGKNGKIHRKDVLARTFYLWQTKHLGNQVAFKMLRKTGNSVLNGSQYRDLRHHYLGHAPRGVAEKNYDVETPEFQSRFEESLIFIKNHLGI